MKQLFTSQKNIIYLNSGSLSLTPLQTIKAVQKFEEEYENNPTAHLFRSWLDLWEVQKKVASHFHADPKQFFFRSNVTQPLNEFILGAPLPPGSEILTTNQEYGAIFNICQYRVQTDGLKLRTVEFPKKIEFQNLTEKSLIDLIVSAFRPETKMLVLSHIYTGHGLILPIFEICKEARKRGITTIIDGAHTPGAFPLDFRQFSDVDYFAGNLHKWWMGPKGTAFGWVNPLRNHDLKPLQAGWTTFESYPPFNELAEGSRFAQKMFMLGCQNFSPFYALEETLNFWESQKTENILGRLKTLGHHLVSEMNRADFSRFGANDLRLHGPLYTFEIPLKLQNRPYHELMLKILNETQVQVAIVILEEKLHLRLAPHIYNTKEEITGAVSRLKQFFR